jgi:transcriptional regulator with XRE-family HTH domain
VSLAAAVVDEVRRRMTARGLSQNTLAKQAGMPPTLLHRAMNGERALQLDEVAAIAVVLDVTPEHLVRVARAHTPSGDTTHSASESTQDVGPPVR